ncbi:cupin domain-containing protein [Streptomyces sp. NPDC058812]|uniref:cupin domain-containing protein n=1 Tax=unclassified Streptomyces TaxID=2593676 RepID=UPI0036C1C0CD
MLIRPVTDHELVDAYGIRFQQVYPGGGEELAPWGFGRAVVEPGGVTDPHAHEENEVFLILEGTAEMTINDEQRPVGPNSAVFIPGESRHHIRNTSSTEPLVFLSIYWPQEQGRIDL